MSEQTNSNNQQSQPPEASQNGASCPSCGGGGRWFLFLIIIAVAVFGLVRLFQDDVPSGPAGEPIDGEGIAWNTDYDAAAQLAKEQGKPMLMAFSASWCGPCQQMKKTTYKNPEVLAAAEKYVPVYFDVDKTPHKDIVDKYGISGIPCYILAQPDGTTIQRATGYHEADQFVALLNAGLAQM